MVAACLNPVPVPVRSCMDLQQHCSGSSRRVRGIALPGTLSMHEAVHICIRLCAQSRVCRTCCCGSRSMVQQRPLLSAVLAASHLGLAVHVTCQHPGLRVGQSGRGGRSAALLWTCTCSSNMALQGTNVSLTTPAPMAAPHVGRTISTTHDDAWKDACTR